MMNNDDKNVQNYDYNNRYNTDPMILQMIKNQQSQINQLNLLVKNLQQQNGKLKHQFKKLQKLIPKQQQKLLYQNKFITFESNQHQSSITDALKHVDGHRHNVVIGNISTGKTSLINMACKFQLPVGMGDCEMIASQVAQSQDQKLHIWDCFGLNEYFSIYEPENLRFFYCMDKIFVIYSDSIKNCKQVVAMMSKIKPQSTFMIRTKCDTWDPKHKKTIEQEIQADKKYLLQKLNLQLPVLATSAKMPANFKDNQKFIDLLIN